MSIGKPAIHEGNALNKDFISMMIPLFIMAFFFYGPRVILLALAGVVTAKLTDRFAGLLRGRRYNPTENSSVVMALVVVLLMPASIRYRVVVMAVIVAVLVGKEAFGGYGSYPFNPAAVGYCVAAISWPNEVFRYPEPQVWFLNSTWSPERLRELLTLESANLVEGPSSILKSGGLPSVENWSLILGDYVGPLGVTSFIVVLACALFLVVRRRMPLSAPIAFLATAALVALVFPRVPEGAWQILPIYNFPQRFDAMKFEVLAGALPFAAVFLVCEPCTLPKATASRIIYGILLGVATMMFRYFGTFEMGICFAILLVNAVSGYFDRAVARKASRRKGVAKA